MQVMVNKAVLTQDDVARACSQWIVATGIFQIEIGAPVTTSFVRKPDGSLEVTVEVFKEVISTN